MTSRKRLLNSCTLYAVLDKDVSGKRPLTSLSSGFSREGVDIIQLRDKHSFKRQALREAAAITKRLSATRTLFIINDHIDIAEIVDCDGVHIGQDDLPLAAVRSILGKDKIIGISCHSFRQALVAEKDGADYISIGPVFSTPTKPEYHAVGLALLTRCLRSISIPVFAIGGIDTRNAAAVVRAGAKRLAVCRALCRTPDIGKTVSEFRKILS